MFPEMVDAFVAALTGGLATKAGEGAVTAASGAFASLTRVVRRRLGASDELAQVEQQPQDENARAALVAALLRVMAEDPDFAEQFRSMWQSARPEFHAESGGMAMQVHGDLTVNYPSLPAGQETVPRQVRAFVGLFVNRVAELASLRRYLTGDRSAGTAMVMLVGLPGAGKKALTSRGVALLGDRFPGGHVHVDYAALSGRSGGAAVSEAAVKVLRAVGVDERFVPGSLADQVDLLRSRTAERPPMLMVLDGVTDPAQVRSLVPSAAGSAVLVTTEYRLDDLVKDGARVIEVKALPTAEAVALLADMCADERVADQPAAAEQVARLCGGLAEALRVAGSRLALDDSLTVEDLAAELADEAGRLDALSLPGWAATGVPSTVAAAFGVSYDRLPPQARKAYRDVGGIDLLTYTADLVATLTATSLPAAGAALETLARASLLDRLGRGRYRMHPLVRLHAARQAATEDPVGRAEALHRTVSHYLSMTAWADLAVMGPRLAVGRFEPDAADRANPFTGARARQDALDTLEAERANLLGVIRAAADEGLDEAVWQLAVALTALYLNHRHHADWIETARLGVQAARRGGRDDVVARLSSMVSRAYQDLDDLSSAREQIEIALDAAAHVDHPALEASVWEMYGRYLDRVDRSRAEAAYRKALAVNLEAGELRGAALVRYFLGGSLDAAGRREEAMVLLLEAYDWLRDRDPRMAARCLYSLGVARLHAGALAEAGRDLRAAAETFAAQRLWHYEVPARLALADMARQLADVDGERRETQRALDIEEAAGGLRIDQLRRRLAALG